MMPKGSEGLVSGPIWAETEAMAAAATKAALANVFILKECK
jgi:hypothetical protein